jgi:hypothetical protein
MKRIDIGLGEIGMRYDFGNLDQYITLVERIRIVSGGE